MGSPSLSLSVAFLFLDLHGLLLCFQSRVGASELA